ncbi:MAG: helix-turn-helix domain-containing protein [Ruthenibacterium sp.]
MARWPHCPRRCSRRRPFGNTPTEPLKELAAHFPYPISKSGLSHRMKKLEALAAELEEASHGN